jgi:hypothetical protein
VLGMTRFSRWASAGVALLVAGCGGNALVSGSGPDGSALDAGAIDSGAVDSGAVDSGTSDAAKSDAGPTTVEPARHRTTAVECPLFGSTTSRRAQGASPPPEVCMIDSDCTSRPNGRCFTPASGSPGCVYNDCFRDAECATTATAAGGGVCSCRAPDSFGGNLCLGGNCRVDGDCGAGGFCSPSPGCFQGTIASYYCHTAADTCRDDADCPAGNQMPAGYCAYDGNVGHWACSYSYCVG